MKLTILFLSLLLSLPMAAQLRFNQTEFFTASAVIDPVASIKEKGLNIGAEVELVSNWGYVRASFQTFNKIEGGYLDMIGAGGLSLRYGYFSPFRFYMGVRLGAIYRGGYPYPTYGVEAGIDLYTRNNLVFGIRGTYDYRSDFEYWGGENEFRPSGFFKVGIKF